MILTGAICRAYFEAVVNRHVCHVIGFQHGTVTTGYSDLENHQPIHIVQPDPSLYTYCQLVKPNLALPSVLIQSIIKGGECLKLVVLLAGHNSIFRGPKQGWVRVPL